MSPRIGRRCLNRRCARTTYSGSYCPEHAASSRLERQPYAAAYWTPEYHAARRARLELAGYRCETCGAPAEETHHVIPLSSARTLAEAVALCTVENLRAVCFDHNPRGKTAGQTA
jgi:hypothetical protein